jgi:hypothetical protein
MNDKKSKPEMQTVSARAQKCLNYLEKREKAVAKKIESVQKRIDALLTLQKRLKRR